MLKRVAARYGLEGKGGEPTLLNVENDSPGWRQVVAPAKWRTSHTLMSQIQPTASSAGIWRPEQLSHDDADW